MRNAKRGMRNTQMRNAERGTGNTECALRNSADTSTIAFMSEKDLKKRTRQFALRIIRLCESLPTGRTSEVIAKQLIRCGASVGANYRAATRAKSPADFVAKMGIVEEECDECVYWMELLIESALIEERLLTDLMDEAHQLLGITVSSIKTARANASRAKSRPS